MTDHAFKSGCPCKDCVRQDAANRFGASVEHEVISGKAEERPQGDCSREWEVIGSQGDGPRSSGYCGA